nr:MAG TPA: hypothetical protein [Caudoviricetes sp.]
MKIEFTIYPYVKQYGYIEIPEKIIKLGNSGIKNYIADNIENVKIEDQDIDYDGVDIDIIALDKGKINHGFSTSTR